MYSLRIKKRFKEWVKNGQRNRVNDLPAMISDGDKYWYKYGMVHRNDDLPAIEWDNGRKEWWVDGERYFFIKQQNGTKEYYNVINQLHRYHFPAIIYLNGDYEYWIM